MDIGLEGQRGVDGLTLKTSIDLGKPQVLRNIQVLIMKFLLKCWIVPIGLCGAWLCTIDMG